jgi:alkanesulfonate monooxygenase
MRIAAKYAHAFNINVSASAPNDIEKGQRALDEACVAVKRDPKSLLRSAFLIACVGRTSAEADARLDQVARDGGKDRAALLAARPGLVHGTAAEALAVFRRYAELGISHINLMLQPFGTEREQVAVLADITGKLQRA